MRYYQPEVRCLANMRFSEALKMAILGNNSSFSQCFFLRTYVLSRMDVRPKGACTYVLRLYGRTSKGAWTYVHGICGWKLCRYVVEGGWKTYKMCIYIRFSFSGLHCEAKHCQLSLCYAEWRFGDKLKCELSHPSKGLASGKNVCGTYTKGLSLGLLKSDSPAICRMGYCCGKGEALTPTLLPL